MVQDVDDVRSVFFSAVPPLRLVPDFDFLHGVYGYGTLGVFSSVSSFFFKDWFALDKLYVRIKKPESGIMQTNIKKITNSIRVLIGRIGACSLGLVL